MAKREINKATNPFNKAIKPWYKKAFPDDTLGNRITGTFAGAIQTLREHKDIYDYIGVGDSVVRERLFEKLATMLNRDYDAIYNAWLYGNPDLGLSVMQA